VGDVQTARSMLTERKANCCKMAGQQAQPQEANVRSLPDQIIVNTACTPKPMQYRTLYQTP
jgi:hypothetical protein